MLSVVRLYIVDNLSTSVIYGIWALLLDLTTSEDDGRVEPISETSGAY
jgi:hypothetical protein